MNGTEEEKQRTCMSYLKEIMNSEWIKQRHQHTRNLCGKLIIRTQPFTDNNMMYVGTIYSLMLENSIFVKSSILIPTPKVRRLEGG
jgi:hypothetical protein